MKSLVCYYRVSTQSQSLEPQRMELQAYAKSKGWVIEKEYTDVISGSKSSRSGLDQLMADVATGKVKAVMAVKIDRMARSMSHFCKLVEEFSKRKVALIIPGQGIDTSSSNPVGKLMLNLLGVLAEFERSLIVERTVAGLAAARSQGRVGGRPVGYRKHDLPLDDVKKRLKETSLRQVAKEFNVPESTLRATLASA